MKNGDIIAFNGVAYKYYIGGTCLQCSLRNTRLCDHLKCFNGEHFEILKGAELADAHLKNPWHNASEELPKEDGIYIVMLGRNSFVCALGFDAISKQWSIAGYQSDVKYWMEIPEIKED